MGLETIQELSSHLHPVASADLADHPVPTGREEVWRFTPLKRLRGLHDDTPLGGVGVGAEFDGPDEVRVGLIDAESPELGSSGFVPTDREGIRFHDDWEPIGLRGADSSTVTFDRVRLYPDEVIPWKHAGRQRTVLPFWTIFGALYYSAVYLGSALAALDAARDYARHDGRQSIMPGAGSIAGDALVQTQYAGYWLQVEAGLGYFDRFIADLQERWDARASITEDQLAELSVKSLGLRSFASQVALEVAPRVFEFAGGRGALDQKHFDRFWRDARTLASHDPLVYSLRMVGDYAINGTLPRFPSRFPETAAGR